MPPPQVALRVSPDRYLREKLRVHFLNWLCWQSWHAASEQETYLQGGGWSEGTGITTSASTPCTGGM